MQSRIYTVSELTADIKTLLEKNFPFVWISGEISNFRIPSSKHYYFTLKDNKSQISAVMFGNQNRQLKFRPEDGMQVTGLGRISVYAPRGGYQIILEYMEPKGIGSLQVAFEQLKARLSAEGLFDSRHKKAIPFIPRKISVITSPTGAVIHDILKIVNRRFPNIHIEIIPVKVQGHEADKEIVQGIKLLNTRKNSDVAIIARGGGSLEDLHAFNSENVVRAVFASEIPIISAVGHETDFTITDFVADLRAPTPSAAAELAVPLKSELAKKCANLSFALTTRFFRYTEHLHMVVDKLSERLVDPKKKIQDLRLRTDDLFIRLTRVFANSIHQRRERVSWMVDRLNALNPVAILSRGYSITRTIPDALVVRDSETLDKGQKIEVMLAKGSLICRVEGKNDDGQTG
ncbi:MAG: exodeoxyribonuclease VII large subunit [Desulfobacteraceae bacterium]|nr:exodeoxyribonuclease VII large subunit [Desulfobacteraceae bacterium]